MCFYVKTEFVLLLVLVKAVYGQWFSLILLLCYYYIFSSQPCTLMSLAPILLLLLRSVLELLLVASCRNIISLLMERWWSNKASFFLQTLEMTSEVVNFLRGIFNMFDIDNVRMYKFVFVKSNLTLICNWYSWDATLAELYRRRKMWVWKVK